MNLDQKFGFFNISRKLIIHTTKHFYVFVPPNQITHTHIIISSIKPTGSTFEKLTNEEIFDYGFTLQYIQKTLESYFKSFSSTIFINDGKKTSNIDNFHCHIVIRKKGDMNEKFTNTINTTDDLNLKTNKNDYTEKENKEQQIIKNEIGHDRNDDIYKYLFNFELKIDDIDCNYAISLVESIQRHIIENGFF